MRYFTTLAILSLLTMHAYPQSDLPDPRMWITDGPVLTIACHENTIYIGGDFKRVGPNTPYGIAIDALTGLPGSQFAKPNGSLFAVVPDGTGGWFIGGSFTSVGGQARNRLARINSDGSLHSWNPNVNNTVRSIVVYEGKVYIGGDFHNVGGELRNHLASVDAITGIPSSWNPNANNIVYALAVGEGIVYAGGLFTSMGGILRNHLAAMDTLTGSTTFWNPNANGNVVALALNGTTVYAGGEFVTIGGQFRSRIAALDIYSGVPTSWDPVAGGAVRSLTLKGDTIFAGGNFISMGQEPRNHIAAIDSATGSVLSWNPNANALVRSISVIGDLVYVGGEFSNIGGEYRENIAALDRLTGTATSWNPNASSVVRALSVSNGKIYAGGSFSMVGGETRNNIAALDALTGSATSWNPKADDIINTLTVSGGIVYAGGHFTSISDVPRNRIAALDITTGAPTSWDPNANDRVNSIVVGGGKVYAGGAFTTIGGEVRNHIAALDTSTGSATAWNPAANNFVDALIMKDDLLYVGGLFTRIGGKERSYIAALDTSTGLSTAMNLNVESEYGAYAFAVSDDKVYAGGSFSVPPFYDDLLRINSDGNIDNWDPTDYSYGQHRIYALAVRGGTVFAGGLISTIGGQQRHHLVALDTSLGYPTSWYPILNNSVTALALGGNTLYVGGNFITISGQSQNFFAAFPGIPCENPTSGGLIGTDQSGSSPFDPIAFTSIVPVSGHTGNLQYLWQSSMTGNSQGFSDISGATSASYDPGPLTQTTWFRRLVRVDCQSDWTGAKESNVLEVKITSSKDWIGGNGYWNIGSNWTGGTVPVASDNITITNGQPKLDVDFTLSGSMLISGTGSLMVHPGKTLTVTGTADFGGNPVIFQSDATGTAQLGVVTGTLSNSTNVTVERYIPNTGRRWRLLTAPLDNVTINNGWQNGQTWNGTIALSGTTGTLITGQQQGNAATANTRGFDFWSAIANSSTSVMSYTQRSGQGVWTAMGNTITANAFNGNKAYLLFVRGPRNSAYSTGTSNAATTLRPTGTLRQGDINIPVDGTKGYTLIGNPYASQVDFDAMYMNAGNSAVIKRQFWMWDATNGTSGNFQAVVYSGGKYVEVPAKFHSPGQASPLTAIQSGHGFFVLPLTTAGGTMKIRELNKIAVPTSTPNILLGEDRTPRLFVNLMKRGDGGDDILTDGIMVTYGKGYPMEAADGEDAVKLENLEENLAVMDRDALLIADARPMTDLQKPIELTLWNMKAGSYTYEIRFKNMEQLDGVKVYLEDRLMNRRTALMTDGDITMVEFVVGADGKQANRFRIVYERVALNASVGSETGGDANAVRIYPNPLTGRTLTVRLQGIPSGSYVLQLFSAEGTMVMSKGLQHEGGTADHRLDLQAVLPRGTYQFRCLQGAEMVGGGTLIVQ